MYYLKATTKRYSNLFSTEHSEPFIYFFGKGFS